MNGGMFSSRVVALSQHRGVAVQPRLGFSIMDSMVRGIVETIGVPGSVATITLDAFTRVGDYARAHAGFRQGEELNGYPLLAVDPDRTRELLDIADRQGRDVQLRHGTPDPRRLFERAAVVGISVTEGGPVSYAMPYGRRRLAETLPAWREAIGILGSGNRGSIHVETFAGCMLGQLCPPSMLVALSILESLFLEDAGVSDLSVSYAQQTHPRQDVAAVRALRRLADEFFAPETRWHTVVYCYMGLFPQRASGAIGLNAVGALVAAAGGADRYIVKTVAEARGIPSVDQNVSAMRSARRVIGLLESHVSAEPLIDQEEEELYDEARAIITACLAQADGIDACIHDSFERGLLDIPYCLHPDNRREATSRIAPDGRLIWSNRGRVPGGSRVRGDGSVSTAGDFLSGLSHVRDLYDSGAYRDLVRRNFGGLLDRKVQP